MRFLKSGPLSHLYVQVLLAILLGVVFGQLAPDTAAAMKPLGDGFIKLVKMMIAPIIFVTVVGGIAKMGDLREVGRVGFRALIYFEAVSTVSLALGLLVVNVFRPGAGLDVDPAKLDTQALAESTAAAKSLSAADFVLHVIPDSAVGAFASSEILQVLLLSVLFGVALAHLGPRGERLLGLIETLAEVLFQMIGIIMRLAPIGAFGAMAFTIGRYGVGTLLSLGKLMGCVYLTCLVFVFVVLGLISRLVGFSLMKFLRYLREELLVVLGTSSSEAVLPQLMEKLEKIGCPPSVVGLVVPAGYSFNLDGTSIYLSMGAIFVAQAANVPLTIGDQIAILAILMLTSKGAATVTGSGFITLAATLSATGKIPVAGLALLLGIDRFMSEARALTNLIGNGVATLVISRWEGELDLRRVRAELDQR